MNNRLQKLIAWMKAENIDASFITSPDNVFYLSGFRSDPHERLLGLAVFQEKEPFLVCPRMEVDDAKKSGWDQEIIGYSDTEQPWDLVEERVRARVPKVHTWAVERNI